MQGKTSLQFHFSKNDDTWWRDGSQQHSLLSGHLFLSFFQRIRSRSMKIVPQDTHFPLSFRMHLSTLVNLHLCWKFASLLLNPLLSFSLTDEQQSSSKTGSRVDILWLILEPHNRIPLHMMKRETSVECVMRLFWNKQRYEVKDSVASTEPHPVVGITTTYLTTSKKNV